MYYVQLRATSTKRIQENVHIVQLFIIITCLDIENNTVQQIYIIKKNIFLIYVL